MLTDERLLRRRSIAEAMKDDYVPRRKRKQGSNLQGPLTKKQLQNKKTHQTQPYKDAKKRHSQTSRGKELHNARSRIAYRKVKAKLSESRPEVDGALKTGMDPESQS